jgi:hypothetical protein
MRKNSRDLEKEQGGKTAYSLGLSLNQQSYKSEENKGSHRIRFMVNKRGKKLVIDDTAARLWRLQRRIKAWCKMADSWVKKGAFLIMATLTYAPGEEQSPRDITVFLQQVKRCKGVELLAYAWVAELTKNRVVHYHVMMYVKGKIPMPDKSGMWDHGMSRVEKARTAFYLLMHAGKKYQKNFSKFPKGIRTFAVWVGNVRDREELKLSVFPKWVEKLLRAGVDRGSVEEIRRYKREEDEWKYWKSTSVGYNKDGELEMQ